MSVMIDTQGLGRYFGHIKAVDGVSFQVAKGEVLGFLGPNGAGKSTTMKMITCFLAPSFGTAKVGGFDIQTHSREVRAQIGYLPENAPLYGEMEVVEFLNFVAEVRGLEKAKRRASIDRVVEMTSLQGVVRQRIETLSKGFKRRVGLAQALIHDPQILILDEPTDGLDPNQKHEVRQLINSMAKEKCIVLSTHILEEVDAVCSRVIIIANGKLVTDSTPMELRFSKNGHTVIDLRLLAGSEDRVVSLLKPVAGISSVVVLGSGLVQISSKLSRSEAILSTLNVLKESDVQVRDIGFDSGQLDEVFRELTA